MNKKLRVLLIATIMMSIVDALAASPFSANDIIITLSNDCFGGELALSRDDYRSYGIGGGLALANGLFLDFDYYGYTDRANDLRSDELFFNLGTDILFDTIAGRFVLTPSVGTRIIGDLGGQSAQNIVHEIFGLRKVDFSYDSAREDSSFSGDFILGLICGWGYEFKLTEMPDITPYIELTSLYSLPSGLDIAVEGGATISNTADDFFRIYSGLGRHFTDFPGETVDLALSMEEGVYAGWAVRAGFLMTRMEIYPSSEYANGDISLVFSNDHGKGHDFKKADYILEYGLDLLCFEKSIRFILPYNISENFSLLPYLDYSYGDAVDDFYNTERQIRLIQFSAGIQAACSPDFLNSYIEFFAGINAGYRLEKYWDLAEYISYAHGFVFSPEAGVRTAAVPFFPDCPFFSSNTRYGIVISYAPQFIGGGDVGVPLQNRFLLGLDIWTDF